ncbi:MAG: selenide, water dikinase SelD [Planctomycetes bacterium]|nr:selenide, water dikinase SelD [Planctomycetota bacterium]
MKLPTREEVLHGPGTLDDAGVIRIPGTDAAIVQTVDFFPPIVDDPRDFGRIAAANSLSDIYAMGGIPLSALNIVGFPQELPISLLGEILAGGAEKMEEANCALLGGHSVRDSEVKYGLAVTGTIDESRMLTNGGARAGDILVLTKALGTGSVSTALNRNEVTAEVLQSATDSMTTLNAGAARAAINCGVHSATDVTGFGLCGHGAEMAAASGVLLEICSSSLPILAGVEQLAAEGIVSGGSKRNQEHLGTRLDVGADVAADRLALALDSETSGGLLLAVGPEELDELTRSLQSEGVSIQAVIGEVKPLQGDVSVRITP